MNYNMLALLLENGCDPRPIIKYFYESGCDADNGYDINIIRVFSDVKDLQDKIDAVPALRNKLYVGINTENGSSKPKVTLFSKDEDVEKLIRKNGLDQIFSIKSSGKKNSAYFANTDIFLEESSKIELSPPKNYPNHTRGGSLRETNDLIISG